MLEISGLPLKSTMANIRTWLEQQVGGELTSEIQHVGLMTDVESQTIRASRSTGIKIRASNEGALSLNCFLGFASKDTLIQVQSSLVGAKYEGRTLRVQDSTLTASEIVIEQTEGMVADDEEFEQA